MDRENLIRKLGVMGISVDDAEDIIQDTLLEIYEKEEQNKPDEYFLKALQNNAIDFIRKQKNDVRLMKHYSPPEHSYGSVEEEVLCKEDTEHLLSEIEKVSNPRHREVLYLHLWEERDYREITEMTGISDTNIQSIILRFRQKMNVVL